MTDYRPYEEQDYAGLRALYEQSELFGGQFDENRDSAERLRKRVEADPDAILIASDQNRLVGSVSLIDDGRVAWLFRFAVERGPQEDEIAAGLCVRALAALRARGHNQVLVYTPAGDRHLNERYEKLGFTQGNDYTCFWKDC